MRTRNTALAVVVLALAAGLVGCDDGGGNPCAVQLGPEVVAGIAPMPAPAPRPPAPRPPAPRAPSAPRAPAAPAPQYKAPQYKAPPRYVPPPKPYRPPVYAPPRTIHHQPVYVNNHHDPMPYFWMTMMYTSTLHNQQAPEGCNP